MSLLKRLNPIAAIADQAWLSLLSLAIALAFIWKAEKSEYGYFILLTTPLLLIQSVQNALINSPLATFFPALADTDRTNIKTTAVSMHVYLGSIAALTGAFGLYLYLKVTSSHADLMLVFGFSLAILGTIARESQRSFAYASGSGSVALAGDLVYGALLFAATGAAIAGNTLTAGFVLAATGLAGVAPLLTKLRHFNGLHLDSKSVQQFWSCGRWALPSVFVTWIGLNSYPYFASEYLGIAAVADIGAARLFLMPIGLVMTAWGNWFRPKISRCFSEGNIPRIRKITITSLAIGAAAMSIIALTILMAYPIVEPLLGRAYQGLQSLVMMWLVYFTIALARNFFMATLMVDANGYRLLHHVTWAALIVALPCFVLLSGRGTIWIVGILCAIEALQLVFVAIKATDYWNGTRGEAHHA